MNDEFLKDYIFDVKELLSVAEKSIRKIENGEKFEDHRYQIYRCFHSIKGASGMFNFDNIVAATHNAENLMELISKTGVIHKNQIDYLLFLIDEMRDCLSRNDTGKMINLKSHHEEARPLPVANLDVKESFSATEKEDFLFDLDLLKNELKLNIRPVMLIVDDEKGVHKLLKKMIPDKYLVINTLSVKQANTVLSFCEPHLVISDIKMPGESGIDLLKILSTKKHNIPVVIISGNVTTASAIDVFNNGAIHLLEKPFGKAELYSAIQKGLMKRMRNYILEMKLRDR